MSAAAGAYLTRDEATARIRTALKRRSGKAWSVTGGRGTAYGWIRIDVPQARKSCSMDHQWGADGTICRSCGLDWLTARASSSPITCPSHACDDACYIAYISPAERGELAELLGIERVHCQGVSISPDSRGYYVLRAEGTR